MNPTEELAAGLRSMDRTRITALLDAGADSNVLDEHGSTLLMRAVYDGSMQWCTQLLKQGADLYVRNHEGWTAWDFLIPKTDIPLYSLLLQYGADVNQVDPLGWTALHCACRSNQHPLILYLLTQGADPRLPIVRGPCKGKTAYDLGWGSFWSTPEGIRERLRWDTISIQEVFILASEQGIVPVPSYLW